MHDTPLNQIFQQQGMKISMRCCHFTALCKVLTFHRETQKMDLIYSWTLLSTLSGENFSGESDKCFEKRRKFRPTNIRTTKFRQQDKHNLSTWLFTLLGSLTLQLKTLLLLLGKICRRAKVTNSFLGDENFARQSFAR